MSETATKAQIHREMEVIGYHEGACKDCKEAFRYAMFRASSPGWKVVRCPKCLKKRRDKRTARVMSQELNQGGY